MSQIACHECDLLLSLPRINEGQRAYCPRCNHLLCSNPHNGLERSLAFSIAGLALLVLSNLFPFLAFQARGHEQVMTLLQSSVELYKNDSQFLAAFVLVFIIVAPALLLCCIIWILWPLVMKEKKAPYAAWLGRLIFYTTPWSMAEIFLIGILVSLTKIASLATVVLGISFWGYIGFTICLTVAMSNLDKHMFWDTLDKAQI